jgi:uncharacterized protein
MLIPSIARRYSPRRTLAPGVARAAQFQRRSRAFIQCAVLSLMLGLIAGPATCASLQQGGTAYKAGRFEEAFKHFLAQARKGTPVAQYLVASMYEEGRGALKSATLAASWYKLAADQGDAESQYALALLNLQGRGVAKDASRAAQLLEQAANSGLTSAMNRLGTLHSDGIGVTKDVAAAFALFNQAAKAGHLSARYNLGRAYLNGNGVEQEAAAARHWLEMAALDQHPGAQLQLGTAFAEGRFGLADEVLAYAWMTLAAEQGLQLAKTNLDTLNKHLKPGQRAQALEELERLRARVHSRLTRSTRPSGSANTTTPKIE